MERAEVDAYHMQRPAHHYNAIGTLSSVPCQPFTALFSP